MANEYCSSEKNSKNRVFKGSGLSRRSLLATAAAAAAGVVAAPHIAGAQVKTLAFWTTQRGPTQVKVYEEVWAEFSKQNPNIKIETQYLTEEEYLPKLTSALAANAAPALMSHIPPEFALVLRDRGILGSMDEVIKGIGESDFYENSLELHKDPQSGGYFSLSIVNSTTTGPLWYRKDLFSASGVQVPKSWPELIAASKALTKGGIFGNVYPFGKTSMGDKLFLQTIWQAGGSICNPDLSVAFNSQQVVRALEFVKEVIPFSPQASGTYSYTEVINAFVQGRVAMAPYSGRIMVNAQENARIRDEIAVMPYPTLAEKDGGRDVFVADFQSLVIPKAAADQAASRAMAMWLLKKENYIKFLLSVPGHNLPNLKSISTAPEYLSDPLLQKHKGDFETLIKATGISRSMLKETPQHKINTKAGAILNSRVIVEAVHDVIIGNVSPKDAAARGADKIAAIMKG